MFLKLLSYLHNSNVLHELFVDIKSKISADDFNQRKRKNIITLSGQIFSCTIEFLLMIYLILQIAYMNLVDPSVMPITILVSAFVISFSQFATSHEMRRFVMVNVFP